MPTSPSYTSFSFSHSAAAGGMVIFSPTNYATTTSETSMIKSHHSILLITTPSLIRSSRYRLRNGHPIILLHSSTSSTDIYQQQHIHNLPHAFTNVSHSPQIASTFGLMQTRKSILDGDKDHEVIGTCQQSGINFIFIYLL